MACHQLIYSSRASEEIADDVILDILNKSQSNNFSHKISGLLVFHGGRFMQLLEGDEAEVRDLFDRIKRDPRHTDVKVELEIDSEARSMPTWAMGFTMTDNIAARINKEKFYIDIDVVKELCGFMDGPVRQVWQTFLADA